MDRRPKSRACRIRFRRSCSESSGKFSRKGAKTQRKKEKLCVFAPLREIYGILRKPTFSIQEVLMPKIRAGLLVSAIVVALALGIGVYANADETPSTAQGLAAWGQVYSVLTHPRCINCHTATNYPQQGDDRHRHVANVVREIGRAH